jgi:hypothetical protein
MYLAAVHAQSSTPSASETATSSGTMSASSSYTPSPAVTGSSSITSTHSVSQTPSVSASHASYTSSVTVTPSPSSNATVVQPTILVVVVAAASTGMGSTAVAALSSFITIVVVVLLVVLCYAGCVCYKRKACVVALPTRMVMFDDLKAMDKSKDKSNAKDKAKTGETAEESKKKSSARVVPIVTVPEHKFNAQPGATTPGSGRKTKTLPPLMRASSVRAVGQILPGTQAPTSLIQKTETGASYVRIKSAKRVRQALIHENDDQGPPPSKTSVSDYDSVVAPGTARSPGRTDRHTNDEWLNHEGANEDVSDGEPLDAWVVDDGRDTYRGSRSPVPRMGSQTARAQAEKAERLSKGGSSVRGIGSSNNKLDTTSPPRSSQGLRSPSKRGVTAASVVEEMRHGLASAGSMRRNPSMRHAPSMRNVIEEDEGSPNRVPPWK